MKKKQKFFRDPFLKKLLVENNFYIYVYDFPQKNFSMCHCTYSPIPDPSKNWSVKVGSLLDPLVITLFAGWKNICASYVVCSE